MLPDGLGKLAVELLSGFAGRQAPVNPNTSISISIPVDHPNAEKLVKLAQLLASRQELPGGIVVEKLLRPGAVDEFLDALRPFGVDVEQIRESFKMQPALPTGDELLSAAKKMGRTLPIIRS